MTREAVDERSGIGGNGFDPFVQKAILGELSVSNGVSQHDLPQRVHAGDVCRRVCLCIAETLGVGQHIAIIQAQALLQSSAAEPKDTEI